MIYWGVWLMVACWLAIAVLLFLVLRAVHCDCRDADSEYQSTASASEGVHVTGHRETVFDEEALARIEKVVAELTDLEASTGVGYLNDLMKYALRHVREAVYLLRPPEDGAGDE